MVATKLFREPEEAKQAMSELMVKGYKNSDIVVIANKERAQELGKSHSVTSDIGELTKMGVPEDTVNYYQFSIPMGGIIVAVKVDETKINEVRTLLRSVPVCSLGDRITRTSPGFLQAGRMSATNPIDAPMSGDFRRY